VVDRARPSAEQDALRAQMEARERASRDDAATLAGLRARAAARALGVDAPEAPVAPVTPAVAAAPLPSGPATTGPLPLSSEHARAAARHGSDTELAEAPGGGPTTPAGGSTPPPAPRPAAAGVVLPSGGPAAVTTGVLAAAAAQRPAGRREADQPVMELRPTVLATDIDRIGDQLTVLKDRLELRDRHGGLRRQLPLADIDDVEVQRRLTSAVLLVRTRTTTDLVVKGLRPEAAEEARAAILDLVPSTPDPGHVDERALRRALVELHRAGVLDDRELAEKAALVARLAGRTR
jgi:hypothetical protein